MPLLDPMEQALADGCAVWIVSDGSKLGSYQFIDRAAAEKMCEHINSLKCGRSSHVTLHPFCKQQPQENT